MSAPRDRVTYPRFVNWNVGPWWALLICVVGGLGIVTLLGVAMFVLSGLGSI